MLSPISTSLRPSDTSGVERKGARRWSARGRFPEHFLRYQQKPPYMRAEDWALLVDGMRLAAGEPT